MYEGGRFRGDSGLARIPILWASAASLDKV